MGRLLTLVGRGGVGKTRLARELIAQVTADRGVTTWWVDLADVSEPELVGSSVARAVGLRPQPGLRQERALADLIGDNPALLVLDNCEHVLTEARTVVALLVTECPQLTILATSREPFGLAVEQTYPISTLDVPGPGPVTPADLARSDAARLLVQCAARTAPGFEVTETNAALVAELCRALEGLPLALELAAAQLDRTPTAQLTSLVRATPEAAVGPDLPEARDGSLASSIGWSYVLCTPAEQTAWSQLSTFRGGWTLSAAASVTAMDDAAVLDVLSGLIDKSIVQYDPELARYSMPESIRSYGEMRLTHAALEECRRRHVEWCAGLAAVVDAAWSGPEQERLQRDLRVELPNLQLALEESSGRPELARTALRMVRDLEPFWLLTGQLTAARRWVRRAMAVDEQASEERLVGLAIDAFFAASQMQFHDCQVALAEATGLVGDETSDLARGHLAFAAGIDHFFQDRPEHAAESCGRSLAAFRRAGHLTGELLATVLLAMGVRETGDRGAAIALCNDCLDRCDRLGERNCRSHLQWVLGLEAGEVGELESALGLQREALRIRTSLNDQLGTALSFEALASLASTAGDPERAAVLSGAAGQVWAKIGLTPMAAPYLAAHRELGEQGARESLSADSFDRAYQRGASLSTAEAVRYALGETETAPVKGGGAVAPGGPAELTTRELEVARLVAAGLPNARIARRLAISPRTVEGHVERILMKLELTSRTQVAVRLLGAD